MAGLYSHTTRASGLTLTAAIYNGDMENHITNHVPDQMDDYSASVSEMQTQADPGESGSESQATSLAGELERLRYAIAEVKAMQYWYETQAEGVRTNFIHNGQFEVAQRGTSFDSTTTPANDDDTYLLDRWVLLSDGDDIVDVSQETTTVPTGAPAAIKLDVETANKKFGVCQVIENADALKLAGRTVSLTFKARIAGSTIGAIRAGVASWTSTADSVTSDIVSAWNAAGSNPTLATNWAFDNTPGALTAPTTSYQTYTINNISVDSSAANVAVFIWTDDVTMSAGDFLYISDVQLTLGSAADVFRPRPYHRELDICRRFYERWTPSVSGARVGAGWCSSTTVGNGVFWYAVEKRTTPTVTGTAAGTFDVQDEAGVQNGTSIAFSQAETRNCLVAVTVASGLTAGQGTTIRRDGTDTTYIEVNADL